MRLVLGLVLVSGILSSCSNSSNQRTPEEYLSAFVHANTKVVAFGKADIHHLLEKAAYKKVPKAGVILNAYLNELRGSVNIETPMCFALEGPFKADGTPSAVYVFIETLNSDTLAAKISQQGYDMDEDRGMHYFSDGDISLGTKNNLTVIVYKTNAYDAKAYLHKTFLLSAKPLPGADIEHILSQQADLVAGVSLRNLYRTSNTDLNDLSEEKRKEIDAMLKDAYLLSTLNFETGQVVMRTKNLFSDALMQRLFFKSDETAGIAKKLGSGKPVLGFSMHLDMQKMQDFMEAYAPNTTKELASSIGGPFAMMMAMGGKHALSQFFTGQFGGVLFGTSGMQEGRSDFNFFIGLVRQGSVLAEQGKLFLHAMGMQEVKLDKEGLWAATSRANGWSQGGKLQLVGASKVFGTKGLHFFANLQGLDMDAFEFEGGMKLTYLVESLNFEMDNNQSNLIIKTKNHTDNALKQVIDFLVAALEHKINA